MGVTCVRRSATASADVCLGDCSCQLRTWLQQAGGGRVLTVRALLPAAAQMLAAARQEEFERWKGHLLGLEAALQAAQSEATNYRFAWGGGCSDEPSAVFGSLLHTHTSTLTQAHTHKHTHTSTHIWPGSGSTEGLKPECTQAPGQVVRHVCCPSVCVVVL